MQPAALFLFEESTRTAEAWAAAGYVCYCVDMSHPAGESQTGNIIRVGADLLTWELPAGVAFDFACAMPDCTHLAGSGARWWKAKGLEVLAKALLLVARADKLLKQTGAAGYLENTVGRLATIWRQPDHRFDPCDYAGYLPAAERLEEAYTKRTCLWSYGGFVMPEQRAVVPLLGSKMHLISSGPDQARLRSESPRGFSLAVMLANANLISA